MAKKKKDRPAADPHKPSNATNSKSRVSKGVARPLTAEDAGWRSPTLFVLPMTLVPIDPPEPSERKKRKHDGGCGNDPAA